MYKKLNIHILILMLSLLVTSGLNSQTANLLSSKSPAVLKFLDFMRVTRKGDIKAFMDTKFSKSLDPALKENYSAKISSIRMLHEGIIVKKIIFYDQLEISVYAKSKVLEEWFEINLYVDEDVDPKIKKLDIEIISKPDLSEEERAYKEYGQSVFLHLKQYLAQTSREDDFSGVVLVTKEGVPVLREAYGRSSKQYKASNTEESKFNIGSLSALFTKMYACNLVNNGTLSLDEPIGKYINGLDQNIASKVTVKHLLYNQSGISEFQDDIWNYRFSKSRKISSVLPELKKLTLDNEPGTDVNQNKSSMFILALIIEKVTVRDYYDIIKKEFFDVLKMKNTNAFDQDQIVADLAEGYTKNASFINNNVYKMNRALLPIKGTPAESMYSTADDLNLFLQALKMKEISSPLHRMILKYHASKSPNANEFYLNGGSFVGGDVYIYLNLSTAYSIIVMANYDKPTAEKVGTRITDMVIKL